MKAKQSSTRPVKTILTLSLALAMLLTVSCKKDKTTKTSTPPAPVTDVDGNVYKTVKIGNQIWMAENLRTKHYRDGSDIFNGTLDANWQSAGNINSPKGAWCKYPEADEKVYGLLYNWYAVNNHVAANNNPDKSLAPEGWHVPTNEEWTELYTYLGGDDKAAGNKMKEKGFVHWNDSGDDIYNGNNSSGFTGLPGGIRVEGFGNIENQSYWWSSSFSNSNNVEAYLFNLSSNDNKLDKAGITKITGCSVRCVKDEEDK